MDEPKRRHKAVHTELGIISVTSKDYVDVVHLTHNQQIIFIMDCQPRKDSHLTISKKFYEYSHDQWQEVFRVYERWKRKTMPHFTMSAHSGHTRDGHEHPWRKRSVSKVKKPKNEIQEFPEE
jgi:hypothetical protein